LHVYVYAFTAPFTFPVTLPFILRVGTRSFAFWFDFTLFTWIAFHHVWFTSLRWFTVAVLLTAFVFTYVGFGFAARLRCVYRLHARLRFRLVFARTLLRVWFVVCCTHLVRARLITPVTRWFSSLLILVARYGYVTFGYALIPYARFCRLRLDYTLFTFAPFHTLPVGYLTRTPHTGF